MQPPKLPQNIRRMAYDLAQGPLGATPGMIQPVKHSRETIIFPRDTSAPGGWPVYASTAQVIAEGHTYISLFAYDGTEFKIEFVDAAGNASVSFEDWNDINPQDGEQLAQALYTALAVPQAMVETNAITPWSWPFKVLAPVLISYNGADHWSLTVERTGPRGIPDNEPFRYRNIVSIPHIDAPSANAPRNFQALVAYETTLFDPGQPAAHRVPIRYGMNRAGVLIETFVAQPGYTGPSDGERNDEITPFIIPEIG